MKTTKSIKTPGSQRAPTTSALHRAHRAGVKAGAAAAAEIASSYDSLCAHPYRLHDVILGKLNQRAGRARRNHLALTAINASQARAALRRIATCEADLMTLARAIEPLAWLEYDGGEGSCSNSASWAIERSLRTASVLLAAGYRDCSLTAAERAHPMKEALRTAEPMYVRALKLAKKRALRHRKSKG